jgi:hypothetical protein
MTQTPTESPVSAAPGSQTLARGLHALQLVAAAKGGLTIQQVADHIGVHRTIAYRLLSTLASYRMVAKAEDGRFRAAAGLAALGASFDNNIRELSMPTLRDLADELDTTVSLLVAEGDQQVAIAVIVPTRVTYQLSFHEGSRYPLDRGAARRTPTGDARAGAGLGHHLRGGRAQHLRSRGAGASAGRLAALVHQPDLTP